MRNLKTISLLLAVLFLISSCQTASQKDASKEASSEYTSNSPLPEWTKDAVIYEVNIRQYTEEGTFNAFAEHLPRLKELGVDILWLMPVHPIGEKNRKGTLVLIIQSKTTKPSIRNSEPWKILKPLWIKHMKWTCT
ncbi:hypothetical protein [Marinilabilia salmonicolor]|uniref:hypothetical protein n=1 Tax=Marinilabilia salmonicolor TaxID=989 RepID=UPI001F28ED40|nr:hypothetical protein [Marinilabilia salmonicolor]